MADWKCGAARDLPIATDESWNGPSAEASIFAWAGFDGDSPNASKAKRGFLAYDASAPDLKGSYKLPFALVSSGTLKASPAGIRAAASRLPQTDIPQAEQDRARAVITHYEDRMNIGPNQQAARAVCHKQFEAHHKAVTPTDPDMEMIRRYAMAGTEPTDLFVGQMRLANDQVDRESERFPVSYLDRFAETLPGKSVMVGHDYSQAPIGRFYDASVTRDTETGGHVLMARYYTRKDAPIAADIKAGVARDVSIGFIPDSQTCDLCGRSYFGADDEGAYCPHIRGQDYNGRTCTLTYGGDLNKVEAVEGSLVWLGAQYGARTVETHAARPYATKAAFLEAMAAKDSGKEDSVDLEQAKAKIAELEAKAKASEAFAKDADIGRAFFKEEIARLYKSMGDEATGLLLLDAMKDAPVEKLRDLFKSADEKHAKVFAPRLGAGISGIDDADNASKRSVNEILFGVRAGGN